MLFLEKCPESESVRQADSDSDSYGVLPLHLACGLGGKSPEFCRTLIEAYLGSERYDKKGLYPTCYAIEGINQRKDPAAAIEIVRFLI